MLSVQNLEVVYQDVILVLRGVSFEIPKGEIVSLLGSNGSGKTTVIRSITGLLDIQNGDITKGTISVDGEDITNEKPSKIVEKGIAQVLEGRRIFAELSVTRKSETWEDILIAKIYLKTLIEYLDLISNTKRKI